MGGYRLSATAGRVGNHFLASPAEESSLKMLCPAFKRGLTPFILIALSIIASCTPRRLVRLMLYTNIWPRLGSKNEKGLNTRALF